MNEGGDPLDPDSKVRKIIIDNRSKKGWQVWKWYSATFTLFGNKIMNEHWMIKYSSYILYIHHQ